MTLYGVAIKAKGLDFWTLDQRWFEDAMHAREWAVEAWSGPGCETRVVELVVPEEMSVSTSSHWL